MNCLNNTIKAMQLLKTTEFNNEFVSLLSDTWFFWSQRVHPYI